MKTILVLGAGRSSSSLINYLLEHAPVYDWRVVVGDISSKSAEERIRSSPHGQAVRFDIHEQASSRLTIETSDVVISLLPANLHPLVARLCLDLKKHFLSASYVSDEMDALHDDAVAHNLLFLNECGLDPGIDHMSAMQVIDKIKNEGGILTSFESFTGGLIAPDTDPENPWRYKFTWNPRNVVLAGQGTAKFLIEGQFKYIPYHQLFKRTTHVNVLGRNYEGYPNRDSLKYLATYGLQGIQTMVRGTLRNAGYCSAWNIFVQLGCCDDTFTMDGVSEMTHREFINSFLDYSPVLSVEEKLCAAFALAKDGEEMQRLRWSGLFSSEKIGLSNGTPAQILEHILSKRWRLVKGDKDFIVMWHRFGFQMNGSKKFIVSHLTVTGADETETAMSRTVGIPLAIAAKLLLSGKITKRGVLIPIEADIYEPILTELSDLGIALKEERL
ncbi:MAG TPA: saccharopine dehydrogenase C-terminal domain-containing protein [Chryseolinea sp.]